MTRARVGVAWLGTVIAFAACSGKTTNDSDPMEGDAGSTELPSETGGTASGGTTSGGTTSGGRASGGTTSGGRASGGRASGGTPTADAGDGGQASPNGGGDSGASGADTGNTGGVASTGGESGTGGASVSLFGCGSMSCVEGKSYCYNFTPGTPGQATHTECKRLTEECSDCACLCPATTPDGQCSGPSGDASVSCLCGGEPGKIVISCFGS
jgi:hypothetical protein